MSGVTLIHLAWSIGTMRRRNDFRGIPSDIGEIEAARNSYVHPAQWAAPLSRPERV